MGIRIQANTTYFDPLPQERAPEDMNFQQPFTDKEVRRTNPKRGDPLTDRTEVNNEKGHDSDVSNRYSSIPLSILCYKIAQLCEQPTAHGLQEVRQMIAASSPNVKRDVYEYVQELLTASQYSVVAARAPHGQPLSAVASQVFILKRIFT
jgi:hypothetical protein